MDKNSEPIPKAVELADLVRHNDTTNLGVELKQLLADVPKEEFTKILKQVDEINERDRATNPQLPDIEIVGWNVKTALTGTLKGINHIDITTPGKVFGNSWRNRTTVLGEHRHEDYSIKL